MMLMAEGRESGRRYQLGRNCRGEGEQNDNNKNNQNMLVDDETICRYFSKYLIMRATCHHPG